VLQRLGLALGNPITPPSASPLLLFAGDRGIKYHRCWRRHPADYRHTRRQLHTQCNSAGSATRRCSQQWSGWEELD